MLVYFACLLACIMDRYLYFAYFCLLASFPLLPFLNPLIAAAPPPPSPSPATRLCYTRYPRYLVSRYFVVKKIIVIRQSRQDEIYTQVGLQQRR